MAQYICQRVKTQSGFKRSKPGALKKSTARINRSVDFFLPGLLYYKLTAQKNRRIQSDFPFLGGKLNGRNFYGIAVGS